MIRGALFGALLLLSGCSFLLADTYRDELMQCVNLSRTREQSAQCRCEVNTRYGRPCTGPIEEVDGGL